MAMMKLHTFEDVLPASQVTQLHWSPPCPVRSHGLVWRGVGGQSLFVTDLRIGREYSVLDGSITVDVITAHPDGSPTIILGPPIFTPLDLDVRIRNDGAQPVAARLEV